MPVSDLVKRLTSNRQNLAIAVLAVLIIFFGGYAITGYIIGDSGSGDLDEGVPKDATTFRDTGRDICTEEGKPLIRLFSTTACPHCSWVKETFDSVAKEYASRGLIAARHWELNIRDDTLTPERDGIVPNDDLEEFSLLANGGVPFYSMGCKYVRLGNGHEMTGDLAAEEAEFRYVIEELIADSS